MTYLPVYTVTQHVNHDNSLNAPDFYLCCFVNKKRYFFYIFCVFKDTILSFIYIWHAFTGNGVNKTKKV